MKTNSRAIWCVAIVALAFCLSFSSCSKTDEDRGKQPEIQDAAGKITIYTVNYPLHYFAERIGGDAVAVTFPAPADCDPAYWMPDADTIAAFQKADLILLNGADYAKWLDKVTLPEEKLVDTSAAFHEKLIKLSDAVTHSHGPEGAHEHTGFAFTTWLDPELAVEHARAVMQALAAQMPDRKMGFETNFEALKKDLLDLHSKIQGVVSSNKNKPLVFSHPVYQYFEHCYGLNGRSVHWEPDEAPDQGMWQELKDLLAEHPAKIMVWEGAPADEVVQQLAEIGLESVMFAPCGNVPDSGDFLSVMQGNVENLAAFFGK